MGSAGRHENSTVVGLSALQDTVLRGELDALKA